MDSYIIATLCLLLATLSLLVAMAYLTRAKVRTIVGTMYTNYSRKRPTQYVYIYRGRFERWWLVKIGRAADPLARLRAQRTANPYGLIILAIIPVRNSVRSEKVLHNMFSNNRVSDRNEWFKVSPRLLFYIWALNDKNKMRELQNALDNK